MLAGCILIFQVCVLLKGAVIRVAVSFVNLLEGTEN